MDLLADEGEKGFGAPHRPATAETLSPAGCGQGAGGLERLVEGFMGKADYDGVVSDMRLASGVLWPIPITMDVSQEFADTVSEGEVITLRDREGVLVATMTISDKWTPDRRAECEGVVSRSGR